MFCKSLIFVNVTNLATHEINLKLFLCIQSLEKSRSNHWCRLLSLHDSDIKFLKSLPYFLKFHNLTVLHGGVFNHINLDKPLSKEDKKYILHLRFLDKNYNFLPFDDFENRYIFWSEIYDNHEGFIVYGHHPFEKPKIDKYSIGIDTGCVYGQKLSAVTFPIQNDQVILDQYKIFSVDAKKQYWR